jgi:hypothetical protein
VITTEATCSIRHTPTSLCRCAYESACPAPV